jgi:hypothetical protein
VSYNKSIHTVYIAAPFSVREGRNATIFGLDELTEEEVRVVEGK